MEVISVLVATAVLRPSRSATEPRCRVAQRSAFVVRVGAPVHGVVSQEELWEVVAGLAGQTQAGHNEEVASWR